MAIQNVNIIDVLPYRNEEGDIHTGDIVFSIEHPLLREINFVGFTSNPLLINKAIDHIGSSMNLDISIGVYGDFNKLNSKEKDVRIIGFRNVPLESCDKKVLEIPIFNIKGEVVKIIKKHFVGVKNRVTYYYVVVMDCGFKIDVILNKLQQEGFQIGEYLFIKSVSRIDVDLPDSKNL